MKRYKGLPIEYFFEHDENQIIISGDEVRPLLNRAFCKNHFIFVRNDIFNLFKKILTQITYLGVQHSHYAT
jgi:hypothetical protein